jgi:DNA-binding XRE family transcriptional regulator
MPRDKLKSYRISINKTQEQMAEIWGITLSFYKQIECGAKNPSITKIKEFKNKFPEADVEKIFLT